MRVTTKGQVTIPQDVRRKLGIQPGTEVRFRVKGGVAVLEKVPNQSRGREIVERMRGRGTVAITTDEIMKLTRGED
ncbi:MAG TPA: AbrB/MazE/SpoVT family DNA-binding domain-containing protein [Gemmatimonadaceae bacterium]|nr:AbrB/MazE/SpoVT family DNA-binding domain-containing protein [Gemmatimonadaceae bacterium]